MWCAWGGITGSGHKANSSGEDSGDAGIGTVNWVLLEILLSALLSRSFLGMGTLFPCGVDLYSVRCPLSKRWSLADSDIDVQQVDPMMM